MSRLRVLGCRLFGLIRARGFERDLDDELDFPLQMEIDRNLRSGMNPEEARLTALRRFGGLAQTREVYRETKGCL